MGYPQRALTDDEQVLFYHHPHIKCLISPSIALILITAIMSFVAGIVNGLPWSDLVKNAVFFSIAISWIAFVTYFVCKPVISWKNIHFIITDQRVMYREGFFRRRGIDVFHGDISDTEMHCSMLGRLFHYGTFIITPLQSQGLVELRNVPHIDQLDAIVEYKIFHDN